MLLPRTPSLSYLYKSIPGIVNEARRRASLGMIGISHPARPPAKSLVVCPGPTLATLESGQSGIGVPAFGRRLRMWVSVSGDRILRTHNLGAGAPGLARPRKALPPRRVQPVTYTMQQETTSAFRFLVAKASSPASRLQRDAAQDMSKNV